MDSIQIILIAVLGTGIAFLIYTILKSILSPKKVEGIQKYVKQGKYQAAIKLAKNLIAKDPKDVFAHYWLGQAYINDGKPELALMELKFVNQNAIFEKGLSEKAFRKQIAELYEKFNQNEDALKEYLLLTKLEPTNAENFYRAGKLFEQKGKIDNSLAYYQQALQINKRHVKAHASLGLVLYKTKQYGEAKKEIDIAIQLSPDTFSSYYYLGKILKENKDYAAAVEAFGKALRDPEYKQKSLLERGSCYASADNTEKAIVEFDRAVKASQNDSSQETLYARYFLAACYEKTRQIESAIVQWNAINAKNHNFKDVPAKLSQYGDIEANDNMKEYLTCNTENFCAICKRIVTNGLKLSAKTVEQKKFGCIVSASESKAENWMNTRQQLFLVVFYREPDLIEDTVLRKLHETIKAKNFLKGIICTSAGFTRSSVEYSESRPLELIDKQKLQNLLDKASL